MIIEALKVLLEDEPTIAAMFEDRIYPVTLPDGVTYRAICLTKAAGPAEADMEGSANLERARVQVDIHTDQGASDCIAGARAVKRFLHGYRGPATSAAPCHIQGAFCINDFDSTEPTSERAGPRVRRRTLEFQIWSQEV